MPAGRLQLVARPTRPTRIHRTTKLTRFKTVYRKRKQRPIRGLKQYSGNQPIPDRWTCKMHYTDRYTLSTDATLSTLGTQHKWNLNSLYDPDQTGVGHQPYGFDQLSGLYQRYKVTAVRFEFIFSDPSADGLLLNWQFLNPTQTSQSLTGSDPNTVRERPNTGYVVMNERGEQVRTRIIYMPIHRAAQITKLQFDADQEDYTAQFTANPVNMPQLAVAVANMDAGGTKTVKCLVNITYYTTFYDRRVQTQS